MGLEVEAADAVVADFAEVDGVAGADSEAVGLVDSFGDYGERSGRGGSGEEEEEDRDGHADGV